jgi:hypothetical protein
MLQAQTKSNTFQQGQGINYNGIPISAPQLADFDGDGDLDMIAYLSGSPYSLILFINDGTGHFDGGTAIPGTDDATYNIGDVDNDGDIDIVCAQLFSNHTYGKIFLNDGHGNFTMMDGSFISGFANSYPLVTVVDIDKDGRNDIIYSGIRTSDGLYQSEIWLNTGTKENPDFALSQTTPAVDAPYGGSLAIGDIDEDGDLDMGSSSNGNGLVLFTNNNGIFTVTTPVNDYCGQSYFIDWDHDGHLDFVYFDGYNNSGLKWRKGDGHGNFAETAILLFDYNSIGMDLSHVSAFLLKDIDNDGFPDVIVSVNNGTFNGTKILLNKGCNSALQPYELASATTSSQGTVAGDLNGDGFADVITTFDQADAQVALSDLDPGTVLPLPVVTGSGTFTACGSSTPVILKATASNNGIVQWWDSPADGSLLATGNEYAVQVSGTSLFYVDAVNTDGCTSYVRLPVTVNFIETDPLPATIQVVGATEFCPLGSVTLIANGSGSNFLWSNSETTSSITVSTSGEYSATITDENGCSAKTDVVVVTVSDTEPPVFIDCPVNITANATSAEGAIVNYTLPAATDNCSVTVALSAGFASGAMFPIGATTVTYTATDAGGQIATCTFTVTVTGLAPVIHCPSNITAGNAPGQCGANVNFAATGIPASSITYSIAPGSFFATGTVAVTATAANAVGTSSCTFYVTVIDNEAPVPMIASLPIVTGECSAGVTAPKAMDNCSGLITGTTTDPLTYNAQGTYTIHWTFDDRNGNKSTTTQTVIVKDVTAPIPIVATLPTITGQCSATVTAPTAIDNCAGTITGITADPLSYNALGTYTIHWMYNDGNGNTSTQNQMVVVLDTIKPVVHNPADITVTCGSLISPSITGIATATDNCSTPVITYSDVTIGYVTTRTWKATDAAGNYSTSTQVITIVDNVAPVAVTKNITVYLDNTGQVTVTPAQVNNGSSDNCSAVSLSFKCAAVSTQNLVSNGDFATGYTGWTASNIDNSGGWRSTGGNSGGYFLLNSNGAVATDPTIQQTVTGLIPGQWYTISGQRNNIENGAYGNASALSFGVAVDNTILLQLANTAGATWSPFSVQFKATATSHVISISAERNGDDTQYGVDNLSVVASPNSCTANSIAFNCANLGANTVTLNVTDASGNSSSQNAVVTVADNISPVITVPANVTITCGLNTAPSVTGGSATATDNCSSVIITYSDVTAGNKVTRTWKATDASGNTSTGVQVISVVDNIKPVITDPSDITVNCGASTLPSATGTATGTDNCGTPTVTYSDVTSGNVITRTWKATDGAGNFSTSTQLITIGSVFTASVTSVPTSSTYTGGVSTNLYLGYGAQSTTLMMCSLPSAGAPYTYSWKGSFTNKLSNTTVASPVFTPSAAGYYTFVVTVTNKYGCTSNASISICVTDIRVPCTNGLLVYVCHQVVVGHSSISQTLAVPPALISAHIGFNTCGSNGNDRLGSCDQTACTTAVSNSVVSNALGITKDGEATVINSEEDLKVTVMPNPTTTFFTLKLESKYETPVNMRVMDANGRVIDAKSKIGANSTIQIGHNYSSGIYYAELIQGNTRKVVQMVKGRR